MKTLVLLFFSVVSACAQLTWRSDSFFTLSPPPLNTPTGNGQPALFPSSSGTAPRVAFANGAWYFCDGNYIKPLIYNATKNAFESTVSSSGGIHFYTQPPSSPGPEWITAFAVGDDRLMGIGQLERAATVGDWEATAWTYDSGKTNDRTDDVTGLAFSPWLDLWVATAREISIRPADSDTWSITREDTGKRWISVAAGLAGLVAVSTDGKYAFSQNGTSWETGTINSSISFTDVSHGEGTFIAVGEDRVYSSKNGVSWTLQHTFTNADFQSVTYGNRTWVAIPKSGNRIHFSVDGGASWQTHSNILATELRDITYGDGLFVAIGPGGKIRYSKIDLSVTKSSSLLSSSATTNILSISSDWDFTPWNASSSIDWINLAASEEPSGNGSESLAFTVSENTGFNRNGCISVNGKTEEIRQLGPLGRPGGKLGNVTLARLRGAMLLTWDDLDIEEGYKIERKLSTSPSWQTIEPSLPEDSYYYYDDTVTPGITYAYRITPQGFSSSSTLTTDLEASVSLATPRVLTVPLRNHKVLLAWEKRGGANFLLRRTVDGEIEDLLPFVSGTDPSAYRLPTYVDTLPLALRSGHEELFYQVSVNKGTGTLYESYGNYFAQAIPGAPPVGISRPISASLNHLQWQPVSAPDGFGQHRFRYRIEGSTGDTFSTLATVDGTSFAHPIVQGARWTYRITPTDLSGEAPVSLSYRFDLCPQEPARALSFERGNPTQTNVSLSWEFSDSNLGTRQIERRRNGGNWSLVSESSNPARTGSGSFIDLLPGSEYEFRLRNIWHGAASDWLALPAFPADMPDPSRPFVNEDTADRLRITWAALPGADRYQVRRSLNGTSGWTVITPTPVVTNQRFDDNNVTALTEYFYQVRGINDFDTSAWSPTESGIAPQALGLISNFHDQRRFQFFPTGEPAEIVLQRSTIISGFTQQTDLTNFIFDPRRGAWIATDPETFFPNQIYYYRARARYPRDTIYSEIRTIFPAAFPPTNLSLESRENGIYLEWIPSASGSSYDIERRQASTPPGSYQVIISDWQSSAFLDQTAARGILYEYRLLSRAGAPYDAPSRYLGPGGSFRFNSISSWRSQNFGTSENAGSAANTADPDQDGLPNLTELMFGLDPNAPTSAADLTITIDAGPRAHVRYTLREDFAFWPITATLQASEDLESWPFDITPAQPVETTTSEFHYSQPIGTVPTFFRLGFEEQ